MGLLDYRWCLARRPISTRIGSGPEPVACATWTSVIAGAAALAAMTSCKVSARIGPAAKRMTRAAGTAITSLATSVGDMHDACRPSWRRSRQHRLRRSRKGGDNCECENDTQRLHGFILHVSFRRSGVNSRRLPYSNRYACATYVHNFSNLETWSRHIEPGAP